jgi:hypothetical protein
MASRWHWFLGLGTASGLLAGALLVFCHIGDFSAPEVAGYCFGLRVSSRCDGVDGTFYLVPGTIFGLVFAGALLAYRQMDFGRAIAFAAASGAANSAAVFLCVWLTDRLSEALDIDFLKLPMAIAGAIAGAAGGALLGRVAASLFPGFRLWRSVIAASALGLLAPLVMTWEVAGVFLFYIAWQGGYAAVLAATLPARA